MQRSCRAPAITAVSRRLPIFMIVFVASSCATGSRPLFFDSTGFDTAAAAVVLLARGAASLRGAAGPFAFFFAGAFFGFVGIKGSAVSPISRNRSLFRAMFLFRTSAS